MVSSFQTEERRQPLSENQICNMISSIANGRFGLGKFIATSDTGNGDDGNSIITLTGDNEGATHGALHVDESESCAYTNSNYQAVNNSVVFGGKCEAKDPGVHMDVSVYMEDDVEGQDENKHHSNKVNDESHKEHEREVQKND